MGDVERARPGVTVLDRVHRGLILFAVGRGEALKRFLLDDGAGKTRGYGGRPWPCRLSIRRGVRSNGGWMKSPRGRRRRGCEG